MQQDSAFFAGYFLVGNCFGPDETGFFEVWVVEVVALNLCPGLRLSATSERNRFCRTPILCQYLSELTALVVYQGVAVLG